MMAHTLGVHKQRQAERARRDSAIASVLTHHGKKLDSLKRENKKKRKTASELIALLDIRDIHARAFREPESYQPRSHNLDRQLRGLVNHMFARYSIPDFLIDACIAMPKEALRRRQDDARHRQRAEFRQWLVAIGLGESFAQTVRGTLTRKEAHLFLGAPADRTVLENVWWARMVAARIPAGAIHRLLEKPFGALDFTDPDGRLSEVLRFYARYSEEMSRVTFAEITDFISWKIENDAAFRMAGRTVSSMVKLSNEWHRQIQKAKVGNHVNWDGFGVAAWQYVDKEQFWEVTELLNNVELMREGAKQRHCVYSYMGWCRTGRSSIFSLRAYAKAFSRYDEAMKIVWGKSCEQGRITIEIRADRTIVQVRGPLNRPATRDELDVLRRWAGEKGFTLAQGAR